MNYTCDILISLNKTSSWLQKAYVIILLFIYYLYIIFLYIKKELRTKYSSNILDRMLKAISYGIESIEIKPAT